MRNSILETTVGAFVIAVAVIFFLFVFQKSDQQSEGAYNIIALFDKVDGLTDGDDVKIGGVKIGRVKSISIDKKNYLARVDLSISKSVKIPSDSSAGVSSESLLGGKYVNINPGNDEDMLKEGDLIEDTQSSISLEQMLGKYLFSGKDDDKKDNDVASFDSSDHNFETKNKVKSKIAHEKRQTISEPVVPQVQVVKQPLQPQVQQPNSDPSELSTINREMESIESTLTKDESSVLGDLTELAS